MPILEMREVSRQVKEGSKWSPRWREVVEQVPTRVGSVSGWGLSTSSDTLTAVLEDGRILQVNKMESSYTSYTWANVPCLNPADMRGVWDEQRLGNLYSYELLASLVETYRISRELRPRG